MSITPSPSDNTTMTAVLAAYGEDGFTEQVVIDDEGRLVCCACGQASEPRDVELVSMRRPEGASDPDDMSAVLAVACPNCGRRGVAVAAFGPRASEAEARVLLDISDARTSTDDLPAGRRASE